MSTSVCWCFTKFSNTLVLSDPEPPMIKILTGLDGDGRIVDKDGQEYRLDCDFFQLIHHSFSLSFKICPNFLVVVITLIWREVCSYYKHNVVYVKDSDYL